MKIITPITLILLALCLALVTLQGQAANCGRQVGGATCPNNLCCSQWGWCGTTDAHCGQGCQSNCRPLPPPAPAVPPPPPSPIPPSQDSPIRQIFPEELFNEFLKHRNSAACPARGFYTYDAFLAAASRFPEFANTGSEETRKREIAAFFAQTSHETTGGWPTAPDGPFAWGYCFKEEVGAKDAGLQYCEPSLRWPCVPGQLYFGRGPIQLSWNYNYGQAGEALGLPLLSHPGIVASDPLISFETALWFWMTPQAPKPSCHDVIVGQWTPTPSDIAGNRLPGLGVTTNIINGGLECGIHNDARVLSRIGFYKRYCDIYGISYGDNLDCFNQRPFNWGLKLKSALMSS